ncbi:MAG: DNA gyrase subunit A, partial [Shewanellaceae bacterium]|nr:DNA gyrase subunit A [Shewanellaceae bacterium]
DGMRVVVEVKRGESAEVVLNNLYAQTQLQTVFGINMVALDNGQPRLVNLKIILEAFIAHRREVVTRRTVFELRKARERAHLLEGLAISLSNIDDVIVLIREADTPAEAKVALMARQWSLGKVATMLENVGQASTRPEWLTEEYGERDGVYYLTQQQAQAILDLRLHKLTGLEHDKIIQEYLELIDKIKSYLLILNSPMRLLEIIKEELVAIKDQFGDERKTEITNASHDLSLEDLINAEDVVVTLSHMGYVKYQALDEYQAQRRGGKGKIATKVKNEDFVDRLLIANTHDTILCFSNMGKMYWLKVYQLPLASRSARGRPIINLLPLDPNERITAILPVRDYEKGKYIFKATAHGTVKKTPLIDYSRPRANGIIAVSLKEGDELIDVAITDSEADIMLFSDTGKVVRFSESFVRSMGRSATGVRGIKLEQGQCVVSMIVPHGDGQILTVTKNGYGKRTPLSDYPQKGRATKGVLSIKVNERNGPVVGAVQVNEADEIMLISDKGTLVRTPVEGVSCIGRNTQGVTLIKTAIGENVVGLGRIDEMQVDSKSCNDTSKTIEFETDEL